MQNTTNFLFFENADSISESNVFYGVNGMKMLTVEIYGTATAFNIKTYGIVDHNNTSSWTEMTQVINAGTLDVKTAMTEKTIYWIPVDGFNQIKLEITSITGGNITAFGRLSD